MCHARQTAPLRDASSQTSCIFEALHCSREGASLKYRENFCPTFVFSTTKLASIKNSTKLLIHCCVKSQLLLPIISQDSSTQNFLLVALLVVFR